MIYLLSSFIDHAFDHLDKDEIGSAIVVIISNLPKGNASRRKARHLMNRYVQTRFLGRKYPMAAEQYLRGIKLELRIMLNRLDLARKLTGSLPE